MRNVSFSHFPSFPRYPYLPDSPCFRQLTLSLACFPSLFLPPCSARRSPWPAVGNHFFLFLFLFFWSKLFGHMFLPCVGGWVVKVETLVIRFSVWIMIVIISLIAPNKSKQRSSAVVALKSAEARRDCCRCCCWAIHELRQGSNINKVVRMR